MIASDPVRDGVTLDTAVVPGRRMADALPLPRLEAEPAAPRPVVVAVPHVAEVEAAAQGAQRAVAAERRAQQAVAAVQRAGAAPHEQQVAVAGLRVRPAAVVAVRAW